jgi:DNA polymerase-3 subunit epsilon
MRTTILFDTETTGLLKPEAVDADQQPYITELYALKVIEHDDMVFEVVGEFQSMFKVPIPLEEVITKITGITEGMLSKAPTFRQKFSDLAEFFTGADRMVAHNLSFDKNMLANEVVRIGKLLNMPWPREHICTVEKSMHIEQRRLSLQKLHVHYFGKEFQGAHRAKADVLPMYDCYKEMIKDGTIS